LTPDDSQLGRLAGRIRDLEPGSRALLDLSVRRRLDDGEIASLLGTDAGYVREARSHVMKTVAADLRLSPDELQQLETLLGELPADAWLPVEVEPPGANGAAASPNEMRDATAESPAAPREHESTEPEPATPEPVQAEPGVRVPEPVASAPEPAQDEVSTAAPGPAIEEPLAAEPETPRRGPRFGLILTVGLLLLLGAGAAAAIVLREDDDDPAPMQPAGQPPARTGQGGQAPQGADGLARRMGKPLEGLGAAPGVNARARVRRGRVQVTAGGLRERRNAAYQAWAYDSVIDAKPLERLRPTQGGRFRSSFDADRVRGFRFVDISLERFDGNNSHSGRSLLRIRTRALGIRGGGKPRARR
jgi:hypothetical protein